MFTTKIIYIDIETGEIIEIEKNDLENWEVKTISTNTKRINVTDYEKTIVKKARKSRQQKINFFD